MGLCMQQYEQWVTLQLQIWLLVDASTGYDHLLQLQSTLLDRHMQPVSKRGCRAHFGRRAMLAIGM